MSGPLNMTLDEIVKRGKKTARSGGRGISRRSVRGGGGGRGGGSNGFLGGGRGSGPARRGPLGVNTRPSSFSVNKPVRRIRSSVPWQSDLLDDGLRAAGVSGVDAGTRVHIANLNHGVTNDDIRELFSEIGELKQYAIHYDKNGRPSGTAEVVYPRRSDAYHALKKYNNVLLDGMPMRIEVLGGNNPEAPLSGRVNVNVTGLNGRLQRTVVLQQGVGRGRSRGRGRRVPAVPVSRLPLQNRQGGVRGGRGGFRGRGRGVGGGGRGRGGGRSGKKPVEKSAAELDKDLESYHADAMNTS